MSKDRRLGSGVTKSIDSLHEELTLGAMELVKPQGRPALVRIRDVEVKVLHDTETRDDGGYVVEAMQPPDGQQVVARNMIGTRLLGARHRFQAPAVESSRNSIGS